MFDTKTAQDCWAGPNPPSAMPSCRSLAEGTYVKPATSNLPPEFVVDTEHSPAKSPWPSGIPSGFKAEPLSDQELTQIIGRAADFNGTYVHCGLDNNTSKCITAFTANFQFQTKSGKIQSVSATEQVSSTLSPGWYQDGYTLYALKSLERHYSVDDSRYIHDGEVDRESPQLPVVLTGWRVTKAWGFDLSK
jgi:hypothetical protein